MLETGMLLASRSTGDLDHNRLALWPRRVFDTLSYTGRRGSAALNVFVVKTRVLSTGMGRSLLVATRSVRRRCNLNGPRRALIHNRDLGYRFDIDLESRVYTAF